MHTLQIKTVRKIISVLIGVTYVTKVRIPLKIELIVLSFAFAGCLAMIDSSFCRIMNSTFNYFSNKASFTFLPFAVCL